MMIPAKEDVHVFFFLKLKIPDLKSSQKTAADVGVCVCIRVLVCALFKTLFQSCLTL